VPLSDTCGDGECRLLRGSRAHTPAALGFILGGFEADSLCRSDRPVTCFVSETLSILHTRSASRSGVIMLGMV
jgi:hypothetical protein